MGRGLDALSIAASLLRGARRQAELDLGEGSSQAP